MYCMTSFRKHVLHLVLSFSVLAGIIIPQGYGQFANFRINYINNLRCMHIPVISSQFRWFVAFSIVYIHIYIL